MNDQSHEAAAPTGDPLRGVLAEAARLGTREGVGQAKALEESIAHLRSPEFHVFVAGRSKAGKSTLLNALVGRDVLPRDVIPVTLATVRLQWGEAEAGTVTLADDTSVKVAPTAEALRPFVAEEANPQNVRGVVEVAVRLPSPLLKCGATFFDTPGLGSVHRLHDEVTEHALLSADAVLLVYRASLGFQRLEDEFLARLGGIAGYVLVVQNDDIGEADCTRVCGATAATLARAGSGTSEVHRVHGLHGLEAALRQDEMALAATGIAPLRRVLVSHCETAAAGTKRRAAIRKATTVVREATARVEFVLEEAGRSVADIEEKAGRVRKQREAAAAAAGELQEEAKAAADRVAARAAALADQAERTFVAELRRTIAGEDVIGRIAEIAGAVSQVLDGLLADVLKEVKAEAREAYGRLQDRVRAAASASDRELRSLGRVDFPSVVDLCLPTEPGVRTALHVETSALRHLLAGFVRVLAATGVVTKGVLRLIARIIPGKWDDAIVEVVARGINGALAWLADRLGDQADPVQALVEQSEALAREGFAWIREQCGTRFAAEMRRTFNAEVGEILTERIARLDEEMGKLLGAATRNEAARVAEDARARREALGSVMARLQQAADAIPTVPAGDG